MEIRDIKQTEIVVIVNADNVLANEVSSIENVASLTLDNGFMHIKLYVEIKSFQIPAFMLGI
mgnify:CR=1 FL=1